MQQLLYLNYNINPAPSYWRKLTVEAERYKPFNFSDNIAKKAHQSFNLTKNATVEDL